ncbi:MAG: hypothetical protein V2I40_05900 [Desulfobacteraceae bacterium]|jgi:hypothetical protein|nr:hypothetical protein [Desulfobacteraceae bacterium]
MTMGSRSPLRSIIDREKLMTFKTCPICGRPFTLGEPVVLACGTWEGPPKWVHENEAVFDPQTSTYVEQKCARSVPSSDR